MKTKTPLLINLTRLAVGGVLLAVEQINKSFTEFEERSESPSTKIIEIPNQGDSSNEIRDGIIGLVFDVQNQIHGNLLGIDRITRKTAKATQNLIRPVTSSRFFNPLTRRFDHFVGRGEEVWSRWVDIGQQESRQSIAITARSMNDGVDVVIDQLAENPEVRELVQSQSVGLGGEIIEEIRERSVSADSFLEALSRNIFRLQPRDASMKPPEQIIEQAKPIRKINGRVLRK
jgi:hypothetical protein